MPTVTQESIEAYASCNDARCAGYRQQPVRAVRTLTEFSYVDLGGDVPGIERSTELLRFEDPDEAVCPVCEGSRLVADQVRPIYPNVSGVAQDALLHTSRNSERVMDLMLDSSKRDTEMAQMRTLVERQASALERQEAQIAELSNRRGPGRPRKEPEGE
jgi:hypothetical protein